MTDDVAAPGRPALGPLFHRLWGAFASANVADGMVLIALPLLVARATTEPLAVSMVTAALFAPWIVLALPVGALVDRGLHGRMLVAGNAMRVLVCLGGVATFALLDPSSTRAYLTAVYVLALLLTFGQTLVDTAAPSAVPHLYDDQPRLVRANSVIEGTRVTSNDFVGGIVGPVLLGVAAFVPFVAGGALYGLALCFGLVVARQLHTAPAAVPAPGAGGGRPRRAWLEGLRLQVTDRTLRSHTLLLVALIAANAMIQGILVLYVLEELGVAERHVGLFVLGAAVGSLAGTTLASKLIGSLGRVPVFAGSLGVLSSGFFCMLLATQVWVAAAGWVLVGFGIVTFQITSVLYRQLWVAPELFARVLTAQRLLIYSTIPVGSIAGGALASAAGLRAPLLVGAVCAATLAVVSVPLGRAVFEPAVAARAAARD